MSSDDTKKSEADISPPVNFIEGTPPVPEWKERDYIKNILPKDDPHNN